MKPSCEFAPPNQGTYACDYYCANDCNGDGTLNGYDIDPFVRILVSQ
jgi:hypothetical protein